MGVPFGYPNPACGCCGSPPPPPPPPGTHSACTCTAVPDTLTLSWSGAGCVPAYLYNGDTLDWTASTPGAFGPSPGFAGAAWFGRGVYTDPFTGQTFSYRLTCGVCTLDDWFLQAVAYPIFVGGSGSIIANLYRWKIGTNGSACSPFLLTGAAVGAGGGCFTDSTGGGCTASVS